MQAFIRGHATLGVERTDHHMPERSTLRGSRLGTVSYEDERNVVFAERQDVTFVCQDDHVTIVPMSLEADVPAVWECHRCGNVAQRTDGTEPERKPGKAARTHWDMLLERRTIDELESLLQERLSLLRSGDGAGAATEARNVSPTVKTRRGRKTA